jgi:hypothetical protein
MSVQKNEFLMIGIDVGYKGVQYESKPMYKDVEMSDVLYDDAEYGVLFDGMNGKYAIIGKVLIKNKEEYDGIDLTQFSQGEILEHFLQVKEWFKQKFGEDVCPQLIIISHFH